MWIAERGTHEQRRKNKKQRLFHKYATSLSDNKNRRKAKSTGIAIDFRLFVIRLTREVSVPDETSCKGILGLDFFSNDSVDEDQVDVKAKEKGALTRLRVLLARRLELLWKKTRAGREKRLQTTEIFNKRERCFI